MTVLREWDVGVSSYEYAFSAKDVAHHFWDVAERGGSCVFVVGDAGEGFGEGDEVEKVQRDQKSCY